MELKRTDSMESHLMKVMPVFELSTVSFSLDSKYTRSPHERITIPRLTTTKDKFKSEDPDISKMYARTARLHPTASTNCVAYTLRMNEEVLSCAVQSLPKS